MEMNGRLQTHVALAPVNELGGAPEPDCTLFVCLFVCIWRNSPQWARAPSFTRFLDHTQRRTTVGRTPLHEWSALPRDLYLTNTRHSQQTNIHTYGGILTHNLNRRAVADLRLRPAAWTLRIIISALAGNRIPIFQFTIEA